LLNVKDFEAALLALKAIEGIIFFNAGPIAGAS
jgi:ATP adenylyltransferase/5',5'''-P-1,P-4-tetraphosphate phosphorylase II